MCNSRLNVLVAALSCVGMVSAPPISAAQGAVAASDVKLHEGGVLVGQVLDQQGKARAQEVVRLQSNGREIAKANTDATGRFQISGLAGGVYEVLIYEEGRMVRAWAPQTAPPVAQDGILLVDDSNVVRGQRCGSPVGCGGAVGGGVAAHGGSLLGWMIDRPVITSGIVAAAIAIPLATSKSSSSNTPATP